MKKLMLILLFSFSLSLLVGQDLSTPKDGNLFTNTISPFIPGKMEMYDDDKILNERNLVLRNERIYENVLSGINIAIPNRTLNTDIVWINNETYVVLTGNSDRYPHGILGDKIESTGFAVYTDSKMVSSYELPTNRVFETLRPLAADIIPENPGSEIILTSSNDSEGARVEVYSQGGVLLGKSSSIGRGYRWLHILGAAAFSDSQKKYIAIVKTPHINGVLELLYWNGESLESEVSLNNISTHQIGSSNLNMALLINMDGSSESELLIPTFDFRNLVVIKYMGNELQVIKRFKLPGRIATNLYFDNDNPASVWIGLSNGSIVRIFE